MLKKLSLLQSPWFWLVLSIWLLLGYFVFFGGASLNLNYLEEQRILARAQSGNIESFFRVLGREVAVLAQLRTMEEKDSNTIRVMDEFVEQWQESEKVGGIVLTNQQGKVIFNSNVQGTRDIGGSLADRDYFIWAKNQPAEGEYYVGEPVTSRLGATKGQFVVPVASPVFKNGVFIGVISISVRLEPLAVTFLERLKSADTIYIYIISESGIVIMNSSSKGQKGPDISTFLQGELKEVVEKGQGGQKRIRNYDMAYSPITLNNRQWLLVTVKQDN